MEQKETTDVEQKDLSPTPIESGEDLAKKKKREVIFEMSLFFVLGILLGITIKTEAVKRITIGFSDYQISSPSQRYNIEDLKKNLEQQIEEQAAQQQAQQPNSNQ